MLPLTMGASSVGVRRSESEIRESILSLTPLGSNPETVLAVVTKEGWENRGLNTRTGFLKQPRTGKSEVIGTAHIEALLGHHWTFPFLRTDVTADWGFDKDDKLIDVWVRKSTDGL